MSAGWIADTRVSYDTVAGNYADVVREALDSQPFLSASVSLFADLVRAAGDGPAADVGCGPGQVTARLRGLGVDAFGIDLSPGMIDVARRDHPGVRFAVGSMTDLPLADRSVAGVLAFWSLIHVPDETVPAVLGHFHRVLRPGGPILIGFHLGDRSTLKTSGYGGHPMRVQVHRRTLGRVTQWLREAGFTVTAELAFDLEDPLPGAVVIARR
ncbi:class I SAM-dependent methyltransferase [Actinoplanes sp. L3-i22]|uniref:class I SAM-dependent methyltransferase n=1 Tax=Actinoplanes sp. L3-i22 TaxID=2836373 RepID=UPI001C74C3EC|nr:class I SAM-dependent methyltransferase [Actinoplanes sp. L3-i22]BCY10326.1 methyltransferase [Actinoplanes sp. L3-i22]